MEVRIETQTGNTILELSAFSKQTKGLFFKKKFFNSISQTSKESQTQILTKCFKEGPGLLVLRLLFISRLVICAPGKALVLTPLYKIL